MIFVVSSAQLRGVKADERVAEPINHVLLDNQQLRG